MVNKDSNDGRIVFNWIYFLIVVLLFLESFFQQLTFENSWDSHGHLWLGHADESCTSILTYEIAYGFNHLFQHICDVRKMQFSLQPNWNRMALQQWSYLDIFGAKVKAKVPKMRWNLIVFIEEPASCVEMPKTNGFLKSKNIWELALQYGSSGSWQRRFNRVAAGLAKD